MPGMRHGGLKSMNSKVGLILHSEYYGIVKTARKTYRCFLCGAEIKPGEKARARAMRSVSVF
jgi:hypothetical protein